MGANPTRNKTANVKDEGMQTLVLQTGLLKGGRIHVWPFCAFNQLI